MAQNITKHALGDLPALREIQHTTRLLDITRLASIDTAIAELGPDVDAEVYARLDAYLVEVFTATKPNQPLLTPKAITHRLRRLIAELDTTVSYDAAKRTRPQDAFVAHDYELGARSGTTIECDNTTHALIRHYRAQVAQENNISEDEAARLILTGELATPPDLTYRGARRSSQWTRRAHRAGWWWCRRSDTAPPRCPAPRSGQAGWSRAASRQRPGVRGQ